MAVSRRALMGFGAVGAVGTMGILGGDVPRVAAARPPAPGPVPVPVPMSVPVHDGAPVLPILDGVCEAPLEPGVPVPVPPGTNGRFIAGTSVLITPDGGPSAVAADTAATRIAVLPAVEAARSWIATGTVPGASASHRDMAVRAMLDLRLALRGNGALLAGPVGLWAYVWPRDSCWAAAAFATTGHYPEAAAILRFLQRVQRRDGTWAARTLPDGSGRVPDQRSPQIDAVGWYCWAAWLLYCKGGAQASVSTSVVELWPAIRAAADTAARSVSANGLPVPSSDYWERENDVFIGNAAALLTGLRAACALAAELGLGTQSIEWAAAAARLARGIDRTFGSTGYHRTPSASAGVDAAVTWLGPPFGPRQSALDGVVDRAARILRRPAGGVTPGLPRPWPVDAPVSWTAETGFFALYYASAGSPAADPWLDWLADHRTTLGSLPECVDGDGRPMSIAPLAWSNAIVLLALAAQESALPVP